MGEFPGSLTFAELVETTQRAVRSHLASLGVPACEVDDLAQDAYIEFYRHPERLPPDVSPKAWIKGIARNRALHWFRSQGRRSAHLQRIAARLSQPEPQDEPPTIAALHGCLDRLPPRSRLLVELTYRDSLTSETVAEHVGSTGMAVRAALHRLRRSLLACLRGQGVVAEGA